MAFLKLVSEDGKVSHEADELEECFLFLKKYGLERNHETGWWLNREIRGCINFASGNAKKFRATVFLR